MTRRSSVFRFLIPSALGFFFFLLPVKYGDKVTIPMGVASDWLSARLGDGLVLVVLGILVVSAVLTTLMTFGSWTPSFFPPRIAEIFRVSRLWAVVRLTGAALGFLIYFKAGPEMVWSEATGKVVLFDLSVPILTIFLFAGLLLPLLTDYGLMELVGSVLRRPFEAAFGLPGRAAIDATASWLAAAAVGVLVTSQQYEAGYYSRRESMVIATNFSVVSLPFCLLISDIMGIGHLFIPFYVTVVAAGLIAAIVVPRLPPLSRVPDEYYEPVGRQIHEEAPEDVSPLRWGLRQAVAKAATAPGPGGLLRSAAANISDIWFGLIPAVIAVGWLGLVLAEYTPVMNWVSTPYIYLLRALQLPESAAAAPAMVVGFADMFLPVVVGKAVDSEVTRFAVAVTSVTQLIYMSEVGVLLLKSKMGFNLGHLLSIFVIRTLVTLPPAALAAHLVLRI